MGIKLSPLPFPFSASLFRYSIPARSPTTPWSNSRYVSLATCCHYWLLGFPSFAFHFPFLEIAMASSTAADSTTTHSFYFMCVSNFLSTIILPITDHG